MDLSTLTILPKSTFLDIDSETQCPIQLSICKKVCAAALAVSSREDVRTAMMLIAYEVRRTRSGWH